MKNYLTIAQFAEQIKASRWAIYKRVFKGDVKALQLAGRWMIEEKELARWRVRNTAKRKFLEKVEKECRQINN